MSHELPRLCPYSLADLYSDSPGLLSREDHLSLRSVFEIRLTPSRMHKAGDGVTYGAEEKAADFVRHEPAQNRPVGVALAVCQLLHRF